MTRPLNSRSKIKARDQRRQYSLSCSGRLERISAFFGFGTCPTDAGRGMNAGPKRERPATSSQRSTPTVKTSARSSMTARPSSCSGAQYANTSGRLENSRTVNTTPAKPASRVSFHRSSRRADRRGRARRECRSPCAARRPDFRLREQLRPGGADACPALRECRARSPGDGDWNGRTLTASGTEERVQENACKVLAHDGDLRLPDHDVENRRDSRMT